MWKPNRQTTQNARLACICLRNTFMILSCVRRGNVPAQSLTQALTRKHLAATALNHRHVWREITNGETKAATAYAV